MALLFPAPAAASKDELLARQAAKATSKRPMRARVKPRVKP
jgi:hypothetical protein